MNVFRQADRPVGLETKGRAFRGGRLAKTQKCEPKKFPTELKNAKIEKLVLLDRNLAFNSPVENVPWLAFPVGDFYGVHKGPHPVALRD